MLILHRIAELPEGSLECLWLCDCPGEHHWHRGHRDQCKWMELSILGPVLMRKVSVKPNLRDRTWGKQGSVQADRQADRQSGRQAGRGRWRGQAHRWDKWLSLWKWVGRSPVCTEGGGEHGQHSLNCSQTRCNGLGKEASSDEDWLKLKVWKSQVFLKEPHFCGCRVFSM